MSRFLFSRFSHGFLKLDPLNSPQKPFSIIYRSFNSRFTQFSFLDPLNPRFNIFSYLGKFRLREQQIRSLFPSNGVFASFKTQFYRKGFCWISNQLSLFYAYDTSTQSSLLVSEFSVGRIDSTSLPFLPSTHVQALSDCLILSSTNCGNIYHFYAEFLPALLYLDYILPPYISFLIPGTDNSFHRQICNILFPHRNLVSFDVSIRLFNFKSCYVSQSLLPSTYSIDAYKEIRSRLLPTLKVENPSIDILYISRGPGEGRRLINESSLIKLLSSTGFKFHTYVTQTTEYLDQISMIHNSKVIISSHGAQLSNLLFASSNASVIELWPVAIGSPSIFCSNFLQRYLWLATEWHDSDSHRSDHVCDPNYVSEVVINLLTSSLSSSSVLKMNLIL